MVYANDIWLQYWQDIWKTGFQLKYCCIEAFLLQDNKY